MANQSADNNNTTNYPSVAEGSPFRASDLQIAKIDGTSFVMKHKMGLAQLSLGSSKTVKTTYTDYVNNEATDRCTNAAQITITVSNVFSGNTPYYYSTDNKYYFIAKAGTSPTFSTASTGVRKWSQASVTTASAISSGTIATVTTPTVAYNKDYYYYAYAYSTVASQQTFSAKANTIYKIECWGSNGAATTGGSSSPYVVRAHFYGGKGGYSKGYIRITTAKTLYLYTGNNTTYSTSDYTFNGGANTVSAGANAGGGTDVRLTEGTTWSDFNSLKSRIIVAGGGGGPAIRSAWYGDGDGGYGGGLTGGTGEIVNWDKSKQADGSGWGYCLCAGGSQTIGGAGTYTGFSSGFGSTHAWFTGNGTAPSGSRGLFGHGTYGKAHSTTTTVNQGCGGGGWYGGGSGFHAGGGGGSGFISGYSGCVAINQSSSTSETNMVHKTETDPNPERYDNTYYFTNFTGCYHNDNMVLKGGNESFTSPTGSLTGSGTETGHNSTGYIIITECPLED